MLFVLFLTLCGAVFSAQSFSVPLSMYKAIAIIYNLYKQLP